MATPTTTAQGSRKATASKTRKRLAKIRVKPTTNGGFVVTHHYQPEHGGTPSPDVHAFADYPSAHAHLTKHVTGPKK